MRPSLSRSAMTMQSARQLGAVASQHIEFFAWVLLSALILLAFVWARGQVNPAEDAVILYEYAKTWASTGVITYGGAPTPIEGATDFLWMALIAGMKVLGVDEFLSSLVLNALAAVFLMWSVRGGWARLLMLLGLFLTPYLYASVGGFSALFFSAAFVLLLVQRDSSAPRFYLAALLLCLIRPDGVVWALAAFAWRTAGTRPERGPEWRDEGRAALICFVLPGVLYFGSRWAYFQEFLPLPFVVKASGHRDWWVFFSSSAKEIWPAVVPGAFAMLAWRRPPSQMLGWVLLVIVPACFYASMRLEQNIGNRFLAPMFFGLLYLLLSERAVRPAMVFLATAVYAIWPHTMLTIADLVQSRNENVFSIARSLASYRGSMLTTEAGRLAYYSGWSVDDSWGLNTPRYARMGVQEVDLSQRRPYDLIVGHCDINLYEPGQKWEVKPERSWEQQCRVMANRVRAGDYALFLVPFSEVRTPDARKRIRKATKFVNIADTGCLRHDVYAIRSDFEFASQVKAILIHHGAKEFDGLTANVQRDLVCSGHAKS